MAVVGIRSILSALVVALAVGACGTDSKKSDGATSQAGSGAVSREAPVQIMNFEFKPSKVTVKAGGKVTWTNEDTAVHSIRDTSPLATPVSQELGKGATFSITYDQPGTFSYICGIHNYMMGSVDVVA